MQKYYILYIERGSYTVYFFPHFCLLQYFITTGQKSSWSLSKNWQTKSLHSTEALGWMTKWCITVWMVNPDGALFAQPQGQKRKLLLYHNMFFHSYEGAKYRSCAASLFFFFFFCNILHSDPWSHHIQNPNIPSWPNTIIASPAMADIIAVSPIRFASHEKKQLRHPETMLRVYFGSSVK